MLRRNQRRSHYHWCPGKFYDPAWGPNWGWLLICDPPQQSLTQLADASSLSKASVSTVARQLQEAGMVERPRAGTVNTCTGSGTAGSPA